MNNNIKPFIIHIHDDKPNSASLLLTEFREKTHIFAERADEGWEGGGYDWGSIAQVVLDEKVPELAKKINFDPEGSMFCAYGEIDAVQKLGEAMKKVYDNDDVLRDLLSRAELD